MWCSRSRFSRCGIDAWRNQAHGTTHGSQSVEQKTEVTVGNVGAKHRFINQCRQYCTIYVPVCHLYTKKRVTCFPLFFYSRSPVELIGEKILISSLLFFTLTQWNHHLIVISCSGRCWKLGALLSRMLLLLLCRFIAAVAKQDVSNNKKTPATKTSCTTPLDAVILGTWTVLWWL